MVDNTLLQMSLLFSLTKTRFIGFPLGVRIAAFCTGKQIMHNSALIAVMGIITAFASTSQIVDVVADLEHKLEMMEITNAQLRSSSA